MVCHFLCFFNLLFKATDALINNTADWIELRCDLNFGIEVFGGLFDILLKRGERIDNGGKLTAKNSYKTVQTNQTSATIVVYRGERPFVRYCEELGRLNIVDIPPRPAKCIQFEITIEIDSNQTLNIEAEYRDVITNEKSKKYNLSIDRTKKLDGHKSEVDEEQLMILEKQKYEIEDKMLREKIDGLIKLIDSIRESYSISDDPSSAEQINDAIDSIVDEMSSNKDHLSQTMCADIQTKLFALCHIEL